jgi:Flp pilus assembly protein TadD
MTWTRAKPSIHAAILIAVVTLLSACAANKAQHANPLRNVNLAGLLDDRQDKRLQDSFIRTALRALEKGDYAAAQQGFNKALKFDPTNSHLHFLNGLTYHLRATAGDSSQLPFAAIGYRLALQYDPANYWAAYQLGHINFNDQRYREAQDAFAYALLFAPDEPTILKALATASYYAQDLATAATAVSKAEQAAPGDAQVLRMAALVSAAGGSFGEAEHYLEEYRQSGGKERLRQVNYLARRIGDWRRFHNEKRGLRRVQATTSDILGDKATQTGLSPPESTDSPPADTSSDAPADGGDDKKKKPATTQMAMVDVVIIRSEERRTTDKGVNLLSGLSATLAGTTFTYQDTRTINANAANSRATVFTYNPTLSIAASYSLNIFNDNNDHNEVLARPSLVALDGKKSEFFTGSVFHVELSGAAGSQGTVTDVPVGIKLDVTPNFISKDKVELQVQAARAFIESRSSEIGFQNFAQITKTIVTANVVMNFNDTLVISGLSEKETERLDDGVPVLQSIPGIQYLFSHQDTVDYMKSVLILLTPRQPRYTYEEGSPKIDRAAPPDAVAPQPNLKELESRSDWFKPAANLDAVFHHLKQRRVFKEFRTGDVRLETWDDEIGLGLKIKRAIDFIFY